LKFECNTMSGSIIYDIGVFSDSDPNTSDGVRYVQGVWPTSGNKIAAGNVFTNSGNNPYSDFYNQPGNSMRYLCLNTGDQIIYGSPSVLNESTLVSSADCGGGSSLLLRPEEENAIVNEITVVHNQLKAKERQRDS